MPIVSKDFIKEYYSIEDESLDDRIDFFIPIAEADFLRIRNKPFNADAQGNIIYPLSSNEAAAKMVMFKIQQAGKTSVAAGGKIKTEQGVKSESWGDHSITFADADGMNADTLIDGYPKSIYDSIEKFVGFI